MTLAHPPFHFARRRLGWCSLPLTLALSACGGGGDSASSTDSSVASPIRNMQAGGNYTGAAGTNETFTGPIASLNGTTVQGNAADTDEMTFTTAGTVVMNNGSTGGTITQIKVLNLAAGSNTISFANGTSGIVKIVGASGSDSVDLTGTGNSFLAGNIDLSDGANTLTMEGKTYTGTFASGASSSDTLVLVNGSDISGATVTGFNNLTLANNAQVTMSPTQFAQFTGTVTAAGTTERVTFSAAGSATAATSIEQYVLANGTNTFTAANADVTVTGGTGNDTFRFTADQILNRTISLTGGGGTDGLTIDAATTSSIDLNSVSLTLSAVNNVNVTGGAGTVTFTNRNGASRVLYYTKSTGDATINLGSGGQTLNLTSSGGTSATTITGGAAPDTINLPSTLTGTITLVESGANMSNRTQIDSVSNFNVVGGNFFKTGVAATSVGSYIIGNADTSNYLTTIGSGLSIVLNNTGQAYLITIQTGSAAGTYLFQNTGSDTSQFDDSDFFIKLTGSYGPITTATLIP